MMRTVYVQWIHEPEPTRSSIETLSYWITQGGLEQDPADPCKLRFTQGTRLTTMHGTDYVPGDCQYLFDSALEATMALAYLNELLERKGVV